MKMMISDIINWKGITIFEHSLSNSPRGHQRRYKRRAVGGSESPGGYIHAVNLICPLSPSDLNRVNPSKKIWGDCPQPPWFRQPWSGALRELLSKIRPSSKVLYTKYSKYWPYTVAHTIDCVCRKMLNHGLNHAIFLSLFMLIPCPIHWIVYV